MQQRREWAIETGIIERLYDVDRGITRVLIEQGLDASLIPHGATDKPADRVIAIIRDQYQAVEGLLDFVGSRRPLSNFLHQRVAPSPHDTPGDRKRGGRTWS